MRKRLLITAAILFILIFSIALGVYFYGRSQLESLLGVLQESLKNNGIELTYEQSEIPTTGLAVHLMGVTVQGEKLPYQIKADYLRVGAGLRFGWPPLKVFFASEKPLITANPQLQKVPAPPPEEVAPAEEAVTSPSYPSYLGILLAFVQFQAEITDGNSPAFGVHQLNASVGVRNLSLTDTGLPTATAIYELQVGRVEQAPWLSNFQLDGEAEFDGQTIQAADNRLTVGPFIAEGSGSYDLNTQLWSGTLFVPQTDLGSNSSNINFEAIEGLNSVSGTLSIDIQGQGKATDLQTANIDGTINAINLTLDISHPQAKGKIVTTLQSTIHKGKSTAIKANLKADLTQLELRHEQLFYKPKNIPLQFEIVVDGKDNIIPIQKGSARFNNLSITVGGELNLKPNGSSKLQISIPSTDLSGWEKFFPEYATVKTRGNMRGNLKYNGPLANWKAALINLDLSLKDITFPILKDWITVPDLSIAGVAKVQSETQIAYNRGALRTLSTRSELDLGSAEIRYGDLFRKKAGIPAKAVLKVMSSASRATVQTGSLTLSRAKANLKGSIDNFEDPRANLSFSTGAMRLSDLVPLFPMAKHKAIAKPNGQLILAGSIKGTLIPKKGGQLPKIRGKANLKRLSFDYQNEALGKTVRLKNLTGILSFTEDSVATKKLYFNFPRTHGYASFRVRNFQKPRATFALNSSDFAVGDFYDEKKVKDAGPMGMAGVSMAATSALVSKSAAEVDFRQNPILKEAIVVGSINIKRADLGWAKATAVSAKMKYDKLKLTIDPFSMNMMGGRITNSILWNGQGKDPTTHFEMNVSNVDANQFITTFSPKNKDMVMGQLSTNMQLGFAGMEQQQILNTVNGDGNFSLVNGQIKTLEFVKKPLETLRQIPLVASQVKQVNLSQQLNDSKGSFKIANGKITFSDLVLHTPYFDLTASNTTVGFDQTIQADINWIPKSSLLSNDILNALRDGSGQPTIPLSLSGPIQSPSVKINQNLTQRLQNYAVQQLKQEAQQKVGKDLERKAKEALRNIFK